MYNFVIPMAGKGSRFKKSGYKKPKPFIDVMGKPMIERVLENLYIEDAKYILLARTNHIEKEKETIKKLKQKYDITLVPVDILTEGAACTVLFARKYLNLEEPLIVANSDQIVDVNIKDFCKSNITSSKIDGSIMTFFNKEKSKKWSFAKTNKNGLVTKVKEKDPISSLATVGVYMFNKSKYFINGAIDMIINNDRTNGEFYLCPVYNYVINNNHPIGVYTIAETNMHSLGTPLFLKQYINIKQRATNDN